jgi:hypothetical protein
VASSKINYRQMTFRKKKVYRVESTKSHVDLLLGLLAPVRGTELSSLLLFCIPNTV